MPTVVLVDRRKGSGMSKRWQDLSSRQRKLIVLAGVVELTLRVAMLLDLKRRPARQVRGSKRWWALAGLVNSAGIIPLSYFLVGRRSDPGDR
jgi:hypothetical protein